MAKTKRAKRNKDMISELPESIILHMLSFLDIKNTVRTCVLSTRWKDLWKRLPALILHSTDFRTYKIFTKIVSSVVSLRDSSISLQSLDFKRDNGRLEPRILRKIVNFAISHNVQQLGLRVNADIAQIPPAIFSSHTLTHLKLAIYPPTKESYHKTPFPKSLNLPALTNLQLWNFRFLVDNNNCAEPFSTFKRLDSLVIFNCTVELECLDTLRISSATLVNLTIINHSYNTHSIDLCTPSLSTFAYTGAPYHQKFYGTDISSLKDVDINASEVPFCKEHYLRLLNWLKVFANIESLIVSASTLQILFLFPDILKINIPSFSNLKSLKVNMEPIWFALCFTLCNIKLLYAESKKQASKIRKAFRRGSEPPSPIPEGIVDLLLQNSPMAKVEFNDFSSKTPNPIPKYL